MYILASNSSHVVAVLAASARSSISKVVRVPASIARCPMRCHAGWAVIGRLGGGAGRTRSGSPR